MQSIHLPQVPDYLREGSFYQSLDLSCDDEIHVPSNTTKANAEIWTDEDLFHYLRSLRFWGIADVSKLCLWFVLLRDEHCLADLTEFDKTFPTLTLAIDLLKLKEYSARLSRAIIENATVIVECMVSLGYSISSAHCDAAAKLSSSEILELLNSRKSRSKESIISFETVKTALRAGNIQAVQYLEKVGMNMHHRAVTTAFLACGAISHPIQDIKIWKLTSIRGYLRCVFSYILKIIWRNDMQPPTVD